MKIDLADLKSRQTHDLLTSAISPLPIALISTIGEDGVYNAAPFSLVMPISYKPPLVCVAIGAKGNEKKDTVVNIESTKDFVINIMGEETIKPAIRAAGNFPRNVDEMKEVGLTAVASDKVKSPRVGEARISLECQLYREIELGEGEDSRWIIFGEVVLVHFQEGVWVSGKIDHLALRAVGRLDNNAYCHTMDIFHL